MSVAAGAPLVELLVEELETLPAARAAAIRVLRDVDDPRSTAAQVALSTCADPALAARLLRLANSTYYGLSGRVRTPAFAVMVVGFETVRSLAAVAAAGLVEPDSLPPDFWVRAARVAAGAALVAPRVGAAEAEAFCTGLLADLGTALLRQHDRDRHDDVVARAEGHEDVLLRTEVDVYGGTHATLCAEVLGVWHFPPDLCSAIAQHHAVPARTAPPLRRALQAGLALDAVIAGERPVGVATAALITAGVASGQVPALVEQVRTAGRALGAAFRG